MADATRPQALIITPDREGASLQLLDSTRRGAWRAPVCDAKEVATAIDRYLKNLTEQAQEHRYWHPASREYSFERLVTLPWRPPLAHRCSSPRSESKNSLST